jgi:hypothetical protein
VVAEEHSVQRSARERRTRTFRSDYLLVREPGTDAFLSFRDVLEVDGRPVPEREERITELFLQPFSNAVARARRIEAEGARYNLPGMENLNDPFMALSFLQARYNWRFAWTDPELDREVGPQVWRVRFLERERPSILSGSARLDFAARGMVWIDAPTGRVVQTEVRFRSPRRSGFDGGGFAAGQPDRSGSLGADDRILVRFQNDDVFGVHMPVEMREWHVAGSEVVTATATYSRFREFQVRTEEQLPAGLPQPTPAN